MEYAIEFHQASETTNSIITSDYYAFSRDFVLPLLLAIGAFLTAYFIFFRETKREKVKEVKAMLHEKKKENERKIEEQKDKLLYFTALVESSINLVTGQIEFIQEFIKDIRSAPTIFPLLTWEPLDDIKRINSTLDLEVYLLAYVNQYSDPRIASVKEFKRIIGSIDFFHINFNQLLSQIEKAQKFDYDRNLQMQTIFHQSYKLTGELLLFYIKSLPVESRPLEDILNKFSSKHDGDNSNITQYYEYFLQPVNDFCVTRMGSDDISLPLVKELALLTRDGKQLYEQIKFQNLLIADMLEGDCQNIITVINRLNDDAKKLIKDFST
jgi:hypothetical protein